MCKINIQYSGRSRAEALRSGRFLEHCCFPKTLGKNVIFSFILYHKPPLFFSLTQSFLFILFFPQIDVAQHCERQISKETIHLDLSFALWQAYCQDIKVQALIFIFYVKALDRGVQKWSLKEM